MMGHLAWGRLVTSLGATAATVAMGIGLTASAAWATDRLFKVKIVTLHA